MPTTLQMPRRASAPSTLNEGEVCSDLPEDRALAAIHRYIQHPSTNSRVFTITPMMAHELLERYNYDNRPKKPAAIARYAGYMRDGKWALTGDTIKFSDAHRLRDGQNRLMACAQADVPFRTHVVFGLEDRAFAFLDRGRNRDGADNLSIVGKPHPRQLGQAARWYELLRTDRVKTRDVYQPDKLLEIVAANPLLETKFVKLGIKADKATNQTPAGMMAALMMIWTAKNERLAQLVIDGLTTNVLGGRLKPFQKVIGRITALSQASSGRVHDVVRCALLVKAWNLVVENRSGVARELEFKVTDAFPAIKG